jgi:hypothetical protein
MNFYIFQVIYLFQLIIYMSNIKMNYYLIKIIKTKNQIPVHNYQVHQMENQIL